MSSLNQFFSVFFKISKNKKQRGKGSSNASIQVDIRIIFSKKLRNIVISAGEELNMNKRNKVCRCESCGKSFSEGSKLKKHIHTVHEGHNDYKCESCSKSFTQEVSLKRHINTIH